MKKKRFFWQHFRNTVMIYPVELRYNKKVLHVKMARRVHVVCKYCRRCRKVLHRRDSRLHLHDVDIIKPENNLGFWQIYRINGKIIGALRKRCSDSLLQTSWAVRTAVPTITPVHTMTQKMTAPNFTRC